jgi:capsular exopolysaccharide synthesis family protein
MEPQNDAPDTGVSLLQYVQIFQRRRQIVTQAFLVISCVSVVVTMLSKPVYEANAQMLVEAASSSISQVNNDDPIAGLTELSNPQSVSTQVQVLQSPTLLNEVCRETGVSPGDISVAPVRDTNVIATTVDSNSASRAALAANTLLADYINEDVNRGVSEIQGAEQFVQSRSDDVQQQLTQSEAALEAFKAQHHVADLDQEQANKIGEVQTLQAALNQQQANISALTSQIATDRQLLAQMPGATVSKSEVTNPTIADLSARIGDLQTQRASLLQPGGYGPDAPAVKVLDGQIQSLKSRLAKTPAFLPTVTSSPNQEIESVKSKMIELESEQAAVMAEENSTSQQLSAEQKSLGNFASWETALQRLDRQHDLYLAQFTMFQDKLADLAVREKSHHATATIIDSARVPTAPIRPRRLIDILLGCCLGLFVGVCLALLQEQLDDRINSVDDAERLLALPSLGQVPAVKAGDPMLLTETTGFNPVAEAYRILRTNINFAAIDNQLKSMAVVSAGPGEGKTSTALNLAIVMAADGRKVILVDTDLRRPTLHKRLEVPALPGVTDVLLGDAVIDDVLVKLEQYPNLSVMTCGLTPPNPSELLGSRKFQTLIEDLCNRADLVIFDTPPVLLAADASVLASQVDGVLMVIETGGTKNSGAKRMTQILRNARANILGVCYNKIISAAGQHSYYYYYNYNYSNDSNELLEQDDSKTTPAAMLSSTSPSKRRSKSNVNTGDDQDL